MPIQTRLELNGKPVRNRFLRSLLSIVILVLLALFLLIIGTILLPIFIAIIAVIAISAAIFLYRLKRRFAAMQSGPSAPHSGSPAPLDPSMEVPLDRDPVRKRGSDHSSSKSIE